MRQSIFLFRLLENKTITITSCKRPHIYKTECLTRGAHRLKSGMTAPEILKLFILELRANSAMLALCYEHGQNPMVQDRRGWRKNTVKDTFWLYCDHFFSPEDSIALYSWKWQIKTRKRGWIKQRKEGWS